MATREQWRAPTWGRNRPGRLSFGETALWSRLRPAGRENRLLWVNINGGRATETKTRELNLNGELHGTFGGQGLEETSRSTRKSERNGWKGFYGKKEETEARGKSSRKGGSTA